MSVEQNKAVVYRYFEEIWNKGNLAVVDQLIAPNVIGHVAGQQVQGREVLKQRVAMGHSSYTDLSFTIEDEIAEGDKIAVRWSHRGRHTGELMGAAPTGKIVTVTGINIFRLAGGKIEEIWVNSDDLGELQQLGLVPMPQEAS
jgi:predicted ester cyclase